MRISTCITVWASCFAISSAVLDNLPNFNGGTVPWIDKLKDTKPPAHAIRKRDIGTAPQHCMDTATQNKFCDPYDIEVFDITYADCASPWVVCRCNKTPAAYSIDVIANNIGKIPVGARSWVRHFSFYPPTSNGYAAYSTFHDINVFGDWTTSTLLLHETGHNLDYWVAGNGRGIYSATAAWQDEASKDTCVPTQYSKDSWQEHFAEVSVQATYEENLGGIPIGTTCMAYSLTRSHVLLRSAIKVVQGAMCSNKIAPSPSICMGSTARLWGMCDDVPDVATNGLTKRAKDDLPVFIRLEKDQREFDARIAKRYPGAMGEPVERVFQA